MLTRQKKYTFALMLLAGMVCSVFAKEFNYELKPAQFCSVSLESKTVVDADFPVTLEKSATNQTVVLVQYDLRADQTRTENAVFWGWVTTSGEGGFPYMTVHAVENNWTPESLARGELPKTLGRAIDMSSGIYPKNKAPIFFKVTDAVNRRMQEGTVSFLIEMDTPAGYSQAVNFLKPFTLKVAKADAPVFKTAELLAPFWNKAGVMVNETLSPTSYDGELAKANLRFKPTDIISVTDYGLGTTYVEGEDFTILNGTFTLTENSSIPFFRYDDLYHNDPDRKPRTFKTLEGGYLAFGGPPFFTDNQVCVSYRHQQRWQGPEYKPAKNELPRTFSKLKAGKPLRIVLFGDSISTGANSSGNNMYPPFMPSFYNLTIAELERVYGSDIDALNSSLGGKNCTWGRDNADALVADKNPDLVILGFGMNDSIPAEQFMEATEKTMEIIRAKNPKVEFLMLMSFQPNSKWKDLSTMASYLEALKKIEGRGVAVADVWSLHEYLLKNKTYWDMTANHVNHPNDYTVRMYAQVILARLGIGSGK